MDYPDLKMRGFHFCYHVVSENLFSLAPNFDFAKHLIEFYAHMKMNTVFIEFEAMFPFKKYPQLRNKYTFTENQMQELLNLCKSCHVKIVPLVQALGHNYSILRHPEFAHLREVERTAQQFCPCNQDCVDFYRELIDEILSVIGDVEYIHIGGDESRRLAECYICAEKYKLKGMGALYGDHINKVAEYLVSRNIKPIVWGDILEEYRDILDVLNKNVAIAYWNYDMLEWNRPYIMDQLAAGGREIIAASAAKFGVHSDYFYHFQKSMRTISLLGLECKRNGVKGMMVTDWTKLSSYEVSIPSNAFSAQICWSSENNQKEFCRKLSQLYYGTEIPEMNQIFVLLSELSHGNKHKENDCLTAPYSDVHSTMLVDGLDRFDHSKLSFAFALANYTRQEESPRACKFLKKSLANGKQALALLSKYRDTVQFNHRVYNILINAAETMILKAEMGLALDNAVKLLKYPLPNEEGAQLQCANELEAIAERYVKLKQDSYELLLDGNFKESLDIDIGYRFPDEALTFMKKYAELLKEHKQLQTLLSFRVY